ncbi:MAG: helix-turn-helix transcriptional regulator [Lentisphaeraceae bacterium]|nr:helix-turn-helix transcriptional regulator [Lentisphaeraceae bacterium]
MKNNLLFKTDPRKQGKPIVAARRELLQRREDFSTNHYVLVLILQGEGRYTDHCSGQSWPVKAGTIIQRFAGRSHSLVMKQKDSMQFFLRVPVEAFYLCNLQQNIEDTPPVFTPKVVDVKNIFQEFIDVNVNNNYMQTMQNAVEFILAIHQQNQSLIYRNDELMIRAARLLSNDLREQLSLEVLAAELGLGYKSFRRRFTSVFDCSPGQYRIVEKMNYAQSQLAFTSESVLRLSQKLGYSSTFSFSRQFKKVTTCSPSAYRRQHQVKECENN